MHLHATSERALRRVSLEVPTVIFTIGGHLEKCGSTWFQCIKNVPQYLYDKWWRVMLQNNHRIKEVYFLQRRKIAAITQQMEIDVVHPALGKRLAGDAKMRLGYIDSQNPPEPASEPERRAPHATTVIDAQALVRQLPVVARKILFGTPNIGLARTIKLFDRTRGHAL